MDYFDPNELSNLYSPSSKTSGEDNGQVTIIGGSSLFQGAPILSLKTASRIVDMVFFSSPEETLEKVANYIKSELSSFIWVPFVEINKYVQKSDAILIGPGFMRFSSENASHNARNHECDEACELTRNTTKDLLLANPDKKWVIDAGSLQTIDPAWIPKNSIITPNKHEFKLLFGLESPLAEEMEDNREIVEKYAKKYNCVIVLKGPETLVADASRSVLVKGGNAGLTKGGTGDTQAGLTAALLAKNSPFLAATAAAYLIKKAADELYQEQNVYFNADDVASQIPQTFGLIINRLANLH